MFFPLYDSNPHPRFAWLTVSLIAVNSLVFFWEATLPAERFEEVLAKYGFVPARVGQLVDPQKAVVVRFPRDPVLLPFAGAVRPKPREVRLPPDRGAVLLSMVTMMFLHGSWAHLIGNMWFLWIFGNNIEERLGPALFALFYLLGGLVALFFHWAVASGQEAFTPTVGASGAVSAVLGAYAITFPRTTIRTLVFLGIFITIVDLPALVVLGVWFIYQLLEAQNMLVLGAQKGVAFWAHVGGFVAGWALMPWMSPKRDGAEDNPFRFDEDDDDERSRLQDDGW